MPQKGNSDINYGNKLGKKPFRDLQKIIYKDLCLHEFENNHSFLHEELINKILVLSIIFWHMPVISCLCISVYLDLYVTLYLTDCSMFLLH